MEFLLSGTSNDFNYSLSLGAWGNLAPNSAPKISDNLVSLVQNGSITEEKSLGIYASGLLKWTMQKIWTDKDNKWETIIVNVPLLNLVWNSNSNRLNISSVTIGNIIQLYKPTWNIAWSNTLNFSPQQINAVIPGTSLGDLSYFSSFNFAETSGFKYALSISIGDQVFYSTEATYPVIKNDKFGNIDLGLYYSNYTVATVGFDSQIKENNYGLVMGYSNPSSSDFSVKAYLGTSDSGFKGQIQCNMNFKL